ncbi:hypothetical protein ACJX0J_010077, partial [Zea mays]
MIIDIKSIIWTHDTFHGWYTYEIIIPKITTASHYFQVYDFSNYGTDTLDIHLAQKGDLPRKKPDEDIHTPNGEGMKSLLMKKAYGLNNCETLMIVGFL